MLKLGRIIIIVELSTPFCSYWTHSSLAFPPHITPSFKLSALPPGRVFFFLVMEWRRASGRGGQPPGQTVYPATRPSVGADPTTRRAFDPRPIFDHGAYAGSFVVHQPTPCLTPLHLTLFLKSFSQQLQVCENGHVAVIDHPLS